MKVIENRFFKISLIVAVAVAAFMLAATAAQAEYEEDNGGDAEYEANDVVVKLAPGSGATIEQINRDYNTTTRDKLLGSRGIYLLDTNGQEPSRLAQRMSADNRLEYAEPNYIHNSPEGDMQRNGHSGSAPKPSNNPGPYSQQYAVDELRLSQAHESARGQGVVVAVLDTGVQRGHPKLSGSLTAGYDFVGDDGNPADTGNGRDDDGDGQVDEMVGHGTHDAGVAHLAAPGAKVMPLRVLNSDGRGNDFVIAEAIKYAENNGADVISMSFGSSAQSEIMDEVLEDATEGEEDGGGGGMVAVAAAGNANSSSPHYPAASEEDVLAVASVNKDAKKSGFSNYGNWVDVASPGSGIYSTFPNDRYAYWSGTSMATPFIAGEAALVRGKYPAMSSGAINNRITSTARDIDAQNPGYAGQLGSGLADAAAAVNRTGGSSSGGSSEGY